MKKKGNVISIVTPLILDRVAKMKAAQKAAKPTGRDWVNVTYEQKELAKRVGCRWCPEEKRWYASAYMSSKAVELWIKEQEDKEMRKKMRKKIG